MCGIAGYVLTSHCPISVFNSDQHTELLTRMNDVIEHRGPDDDGYLHFNQYHLGMRRLSIIDLNTGQQPIYNEDHSKAIVFNGEIYNFPELKIDLLKKGHSFRTQSDTEVIVHLYEQYGFDCVKYIKGMFAFAILDKQQDILFSARDRAGEKPYHYYFKNGLFAFASEIKSIIQIPCVERIINLNALNDYLTYEYIPAPNTIYKDILKLEPGHYLILRRNELTLHKFWELGCVLHDQALFEDKEPEIIRVLDNKLSSAVKSQMICDVPIGAFLSGGIDSSLIAAYMSQFSSSKINTFNIAFDDVSFDESSFARQVAQFLGTNHHEITLTPDKMTDIISEIIHKLDEPFADASLIPTYLLAKFTKENVTVALSGDAGDELFAGYPTYYAHKIAQMFPKLLIWPCTVAARLLKVNDDNISFDFKVKKFLSGLRYKPEYRNQIWLGSFTPEEKKLLFQKDVLHNINEKEFSLIDKIMSNCKSNDFINRILYQDMKFYLQDNMLFKVDRASMLASLEVRVPFLDPDILDFVYKLPSSMKLNKNKSKYILKKVALKYLPKEIVHRKKKGFGVPIAKWIKGRLYPVFKEQFQEHSLLQEGFFNTEYINLLMNEHLNNKKDNRKQLWTLFVFQEWLKSHPINR